MSPFFVEASVINFEEHFDVLVSFWEQVLFYTGGYARNVMNPHILLNGKMKIEKEHFNRWLMFFNQTVDELFFGERAEMAKEKANQMAILMEMKVRASENKGFVL